MQKNLVKYREGIYHEEDNAVPVKEQSYCTFN